MWPIHDFFILSNLSLFLFLAGSYWFNSAIHLSTTGGCRNGAEKEGLGGKKGAPRRTRSGYRHGAFCGLLLISSLPTADCHWQKQHQRESDRPLRHRNEPTTWRIRTPPFWSKKEKSFSLLRMLQRRSLPVWRWGHHGGTAINVMASNFGRASKLVEVGGRCGLDTDKEVAVKAELPIPRHVSQPVAAYTGRLTSLVFYQNIWGGGGICRKLDELIFDSYFFCPAWISFFPFPPLPPSPSLVNCIVYARFSSPTSRCLHYTLRPIFLPRQA